ncbi:hypothetical protein FOZ62_029076, partial [Perkinsus olseni]
KPEDQYTFECRWKDLARFYQMQPGYLFNKLEKLQNMHVDATYQYYDVMQWSTGEAYRRATMKAIHKELVHELPCDKYRPIMYKLVVDDTEFSPTESVAARGGGMAPS